MASRYVEHSRHPVQRRPPAEGDWLSVEAERAARKLAEVNQLCRMYAAKAEAKSKVAVPASEEPRAADGFTNLFLRSGLRPDEAERRAEKLKQAYKDLDAQGSRGG
jgi:hypothetical protein